jgi:hypothetical protein
MKDLTLADSVGCEHTFYLLRMVGDAEGEDNDFVHGYQGVHQYCWLME